MLFDSLRLGDIVCWDGRRISSNIESIPNSNLWKQEELNCLMQVTDLRNELIGSHFTVECVKVCGCHLTETVTREEYMDYYDAVGADIIMFADSAEASLVFGSEDEEEKRYKFLRDFKLILEKVTTGTLPSVVNKRKNKCRM